MINSLAIQLSINRLLYKFDRNFARNEMLSGSDWSTKLFRCNWNSCRKVFAFLIAKMLETVGLKNRLRKPNILL